MPYGITARRSAKQIGGFVLWHRSKTGKHHLRHQVQAGAKCQSRRLQASIAILVNPDN